MPLRELDILAMVRTSLPGGGSLTDDCGELLASVGGRLLVTTDLMEEGTHFRREWHPPRLLGRKLLTVNLSDLDASGAVPLGFTLTLALPADLDVDWLGAFLEGLAEVAREHRIPVLGGDTVGRAAGIGLGVTAFGRAQRWLTRDRVTAGDQLFVDQPLGWGLRGLRRLQKGQRWDETCPDPELSAHLDPRPNLGLGPRLAALSEVHACIDLSDGLSMDLRRLAEASRCSIILEDTLESDEIQGGEDYARCFASPLSGADLEARLGVQLRRVGLAVEPMDAPLLARHKGTLHPLPALGFDHFRP
jgi:thiamine-monophosphate kinase